MSTITRLAIARRCQLVQGKTPSAVYLGLEDRDELVRNAPPGELLVRESGRLAYRGLPIYLVDEPRHLRVV
jgi:hypothetical protein